ncbi:MAG: hypothetical protein WDN49_20400 [Acetobacteraceae bacterium]
MAALVCALPAICWPRPATSPGFLLRETLRGPLAGGAAAAIVAGGLLFHAAVERPAGAVAGEPCEQMFTASFLLGPFAESVTGFGVGSIFAISAVRRAGGEGAPARRARAACPVADSLGRARPGQRARRGPGGRAGPAHDGARRPAGRRVPAVPAAAVLALGGARRAAGGAASPAVAAWLGGGRGGAAGAVVPPAAVGGRGRAGDGSAAGAPAAAGRAAARGVGLVDGGRRGEPVHAARGGAARGPALDRCAVWRAFATCPLCR